ncbi:MAG: hypothetical protein RBS89_01000 [Candidatus Delongbacteria bacterium]|jgi:hypothetical protein|nr:hypothetical protein [Candidatus Delongbacteria bacterium]
MADFKNFAKQLLKDVAQGVAQGVIQEKIDSTQDPKELSMIFNMSKDNNVKRSIIEKLIRLKSVSELMSLLDKGYNRSLVHALIVLCSDKKEILLKLFGKVTERPTAVALPDYDKKIVVQLINLKATQELKKLLDKGYNSLIVPYLIGAHNDPNEIYGLLGADINSDDRIIDYLLFKNEISLLEKLIGRGYDKKIVPFLIESYKTNPQKMKILMGIDKDYDDMIYEGLVNLNAKDELRELVRNDSEYKYDIMSSDETQNLFDKDEASSFIKKEIFEKSNDPDSCVKSFLNILKILSAIRNTAAVKELIIKYFSEVFDYGLKNNSYSAFITLYILDKTRYNKLISSLQDNYAIVRNIEASKDKIKKEYSLKIALEDDKYEVEELLLQRNKEINRLIPQSAESLLSEIEKNFVPMPSIINETFSGAEKIDIININQCRIKDDIESEKKELEKKLRDEVYNLEDINDIMKAKAKYKKELSLVVDSKDLLYSISQLTIEEINSDRYISVLGDLLLKSKDYKFKKLIIQKSSLSANLIWLDYYENIQDIDIFYDELVSSLSNKISARNLKLLINSVGKCGPIPLLMHIYYLINNADTTDIKHLKEAIAIIDRFKYLEDKEDIKRILDNIIMKSGKSSKEIEISDWNNSESRDILINK